MSSKAWGGRFQQTEDWVDEFNASIDLTKTLLMKMSKVVLHATMLANQKSFHKMIKTQSLMA